MCHRELSGPERTVQMGFNVEPTVGWKGIGKWRGWVVVTLVGDMD
jgi:hypothetical protein